MTIKINNYDLSDKIESCERNLDYRTNSKGYIGSDDGMFNVEGMGVLSFDLRGRMKDDYLDELKENILTSDEVLRFYYSHSNKYSKVKVTSYSEERVGGLPNMTDVSFTLETQNPFMYGAKRDYTTSISSGTTVDYVNRGNVYSEPDIDITGESGTMTNLVINDSAGREYKYVGTITPNDTLVLTPEYEVYKNDDSDINNVFGDYPYIQVRAGSETWDYTADGTYSYEARVVYEERWY